MMMLLLVLFLSLCQKCVLSGSGQQNERPELFRKKGINGNNPHNPSVLVKPRRNDPSCSHDLFRVPKTGSTALYNAAQTDAALHKNVCWNNGLEWHREPLVNNSRPILVALRHPRELLLSHMKYQGYWTGDNSTIDSHQWLVRTMRLGLAAFVPGQPPVTDGRSHLLTNYVLDRGLELTRRAGSRGSSTEATVDDEDYDDDYDRIRGHSRGRGSRHGGGHVRVSSGGAGAGRDSLQLHGDVYMCIGEGFPLLHTQLRQIFNDTTIKDIPYENINHRREGTDFVPRDEGLLRQFLRRDLAVWRQHCEPNLLTHPPPRDTAASRVPLRTGGGPGHELGKGSEGSGRKQCRQCVRAPCPC